MSLLRGLWTQLAVLRDTVESGGAEALGSVRSRLVALCAEIETTLSAEI